MGPGEALHPLRSPGDMRGPEATRPDAGFATGEVCL